MTDRDYIDVLDLLEEAVASHVLREAPEGYAFAQPLIRETLYQGLTSTRLTQLRGRTAEELEALYGADLEPQQKQCIVVIDHDQNLLLLTAGEPSVNRCP